VEPSGTSTDTGLAALYTRLRSSTAARDGLWVLAGQGLAAVIALGVDVLLFRNLPQSERGMLTAVLGLRNVLLYIADMGLALTTVRVGAEYFGKGLRAEANAIFRRAFLARMALALLVSLLAYAMARMLARFPLAAPDRPELVVAAAAALVGMTATSWGVDVAQATRSFGRYFLHQVVEATLKAAAVALVLFAAAKLLPGRARFEVSAEMFLWGMASAAILAGLFSILLQHTALAEAKRLSGTAETEIHAQLRSFNRYAVAIALLQTVGGYVEVFLVQWQRGPVDTAIFDGARRLALVLPLLGGVLTTVLLPRVAVLETPAACAAYVRKTWAVGVPLALLAAGGLAAVAGIAVPLLWGRRYDDSIMPLRWLCAGHGFSIVLAPLMLVFYPLRRERTLLMLQAGSVALSIGLGAWLIPRFGALGAAWSTVAVRTLLTLVCGATLWLMLRRSSTSGARQ